MLRHQLHGFRLGEGEYRQRTNYAFSLRVIKHHRILRPVVLIKCFMRPAFGAAAHLFFRFQLSKISIHGAEADLLLCQRVRHLACSQQLVRVLPQKSKQSSSLFCIIA